MMRPHETCKPWRKTIRGARRKETLDERRHRTRNAPKARDLDALTQQLLESNDARIREHDERRARWAA